MKLAGARGITRSRVPLIALMALAAIGMAGCEGDDGKTGSQGPPGTDGTPGTPGATGPTGPGATLEARESCDVCHGTNSAYSVEDAHGIDREVTFAVVSPPAADGADIVITFNIKVDGVNYPYFTSASRAVVFNGDAGVYTQYDRRTGATSVYDPVTGNYTTRIVGAAAEFPNQNSRYYFRLHSVDADPARRASVYADDVAYARVSLASNEACQNCHSTYAGGLTSHHYNPFNADSCVACHSAVNPAGGYSLMELAHGIHNSHHMPSGEYEGFSVTYPTYTTNCSVCHDSPAALAEANDMPVSGPGCFSCHESMESWEFASALSFHESYTEATNCSAGCHTGGVARATVAEFHDGLETERIGIIYGGQDLSVTEGAKFNWEITQVVDNKTTGNLEISWTAEYPKGTSINPCNTTASASAPVFFPFGPNTANEGTLSMLRSYAQGDDYVLGQANAPGQAAAVNLSTTNTTCAGNVATTIITRDNMSDGTRGIVALQGKPQLPVPAGMSDEHWTYPLMFVRVPTPTYEFVVGTGAPATERRLIADTGACLKCHVGSLYQHGNTRVDNVTMCIICHNSASSDQNNRVLMGVTASEAYDGKVGQTYEMKTMVHAIHSAGLGKAPYVVYRTRGIYAWTAEDATLPNWATGEACVNGTTSGIRVFGSDPAVPQSCQPHNLYHPTYSRDENDCAACHVAGFDMVPDQSQAVATTIDAGQVDSGTTNVWKNQLDDTLQGASAAACTSCHQSTAEKGHAYQNGWTPQTFPNGRQTILDTK